MKYRTWNVSHHFFKSLLCSLLFILESARFGILTEHSICSKDTLKNKSLGSCASLTYKMCFGLWLRSRAAFLYDLDWKGILALPDNSLLLTFA